MTKQKKRKFVQRAQKARETKDAKREKKVRRQNKKTAVITAAIRSEVDQDTQSNISVAQQRTKKIAGDHTLPDVLKINVQYMIEPPRQKLVRELDPNYVNVLVRAIDDNRWVVINTFALEMVRLSKAGLESLKEGSSLNFENKDNFIAITDLTEAHRLLARDLSGELTSAEYHNGELFFLTLGGNTARKALQTWLAKQPQPVAPTAYKEVRFKNSQIYFNLDRARETKKASSIPSSNV